MDWPLLWSLKEPHGSWQRIYRNKNAMYLRSCIVATISICVCNKRYLFSILGPCKSVKCTWKAWTEWSATCGLAERTRSIQTTNIVVQQPDCSGLPQTCTQPPQKETKKTMCTCQTVQCAWSQWSDWSATCGKATRSRKIQ